MFLLKKMKKKRWVADYFDFESSYFEKVENVYGGLITGQGKYSYSSSIINSSFINCTSIYEIRITLNANHYSNNSFYISSSDGYGGVFHLEGNGELWLYFWTFLKCKNTLQNPSSDVEGAEGAISDMSNRYCRFCWANFFWMFFSKYRFMLLFKNK